MSWSDSLQWYEWENCLFSMAVLCRVFMMALERDTDKTVILQCHLKKKCMTWRLWVLYGDLSLGDSLSDSSEELLLRGDGEARICMNWWATVVANGLIFVELEWQAVFFLYSSDFYSFWGYLVKDSALMWQIKSQSQSSQKKRSK